MFQTRKSASTKLPIPKKGPKYIARASSNLNNSVTVVVAIRDMLKLAKTAKEVKNMIKQKLLKINGKTVMDYRQSILLFSILEADKSYELSLLPTKKYVLVPAQTKNQRLCKVFNKRLISEGRVQYNMHDGTNIISKDKINVGDSVYLDFQNKIKKIVAIEKSKDGFVISGKYQGQKCKIKDFKDNIVKVELEGGSADLDKMSVVIL